MRWPSSSILVILFMLSYCTARHDQVESRTIYHAVDAKQHGIDFINRIDPDDSINIINYLYAYNGGGVAGGDLNGDGLPELFFTSNRGENKLYLNKGNFFFEDITTSAGLRSKGGWYTGVSMVDVNVDGLLDIYLCQVGSHLFLKGQNELYINQGNLRFKESAQDYGLAFQGYATQSAFFDYDQDGDLDMYLLCHSVHSAESYRDTAMRFTQDILSGDKLFRNDGQMFTDISKQAGIFGSVLGYGLGVNISDFNRDGWPDIYVSNDFHENDYLYINNHDGTFSDRSHSMPCHSQFSMGNAVGDLDNNSWPDIMTLDMRPMTEYLRKTAPEPDALDIFRYKLGFGFYYQYPRNMVHLNQGFDQNHEPWFQEVGQLYGLEATDWSWSAVLTDANLDGRKDILVSNGIVRRPNDLDYLNYTYQDQQKKLTDQELAALMPAGAVPNQIFIQNEGFTFSQDSLGQANCVTGLIAIDLDADGDEDLVGNAINDPVWLMENKSVQNHYLRVETHSAQVLTVELVCDNLKQFYQLGPRLSFQSGAFTPVTIGLGKYRSIDTLKILRGTDVVQSYTGLGVDTLLKLEIGVLSKPEGLPGLKFDDQVKMSLPGLSLKHQENTYQDEVAEPFIPYYLSESGPCMAIGDVNQDSLEDIFFGATQSRAAQLAIQTKNGSFKLSTLTPVSAAKQEDVDALFCDLEADGDLDLIIAGGGSEVGTNLNYTTRIYLNENKGNLKYCPTCLPPFPLNAAVVRAGDIDGDGDKDLFVGGKSKPGQYGASPFSLIFINNGAGQFSIGDTSFIRPFGSLGMVTDAQFVNLDDDGEDELVVVGHWMPVTYFDFHPGHISVTKLANTEGWWNCLVPSDFDGDGDQDFLLGNWGLNSPLRADTAQPLQLYLGDFDQNGFVEPLITYFHQGMERTLLGKETLQKHVPILKRYYPKFSAFAATSFSKLFPNGFSTQLVYKKVVELRSGTLINHGAMEWNFVPFDLKVQCSPIYAITSINLPGQTMYLLGGNNYSAQPYLGRINNLRQQAMLVDEHKQFKHVQLSNLQLTGEVRILKTMPYQNHRILLCGSINQPLTVYNLKQINYQPW